MQAASKQHRSVKRKVLVWFYKRSVCDAQFCESQLACGGTLQVVTHDSFAYAVNDLGTSVFSLFRSPTPPSSSAVWERLPYLCTACIVFKFQHTARYCSQPATEYRRTQRDSRRQPGRHFCVRCWPARGAAAAMQHAFSPLRHDAVQVDQLSQVLAGTACRPRGLAKLDGMLLTIVFSPVRCRRSRLFQAACTWLH